MIKSIRIECEKSMKRNKEGFIISSEYFEYILDCLRDNGPSRYREIADCIYEKMKHFFISADIERHQEYGSRIKWEHQVSEALFTLKKKGIIKLSNNKIYEII